ncbi:alpha/beta hydrolase [Curtobacterium sp. BRD11]|uniref:alpha/beta hydrolase n=1 Tax=Curtobacterium sp. BRD11 TaxID=2962581 RepID=UPI002881130E|nr:alpha/beta hydrolase [Curtobacterium sp. BRD11]MDT0209004.1 alpha/beta hydrolase [Curtobacterium sp. BRD11]
MFAIASATLGLRLSIRQRRSRLEAERARVDAIAAEQVRGQLEAEVAEARAAATAAVQASERLRAARAADESERDLERKEWGREVERLRSALGDRMQSPTAVADDYQRPEAGRAPVYSRAADSRMEDGVRAAEKDADWLGRALDETADPAVERDGEIYPVWFATNRKHSGRGTFGHQRDVDTVSYGLAHVHVPKAHQFGSVGRMGWWQRLPHLGRDAPLELLQVGVADAAVIAAELRHWIASTPDVESRALVYLHGFNSTFEESAIRAAQIGYDLKFPGAMAFFSWPSHGSRELYLYDADSARISAEPFVKFLQTLRDAAGVERIDILAHSMGNLVYSGAVDILMQAAQRGGVKLGAVLLAAPDLDVDEFRIAARKYPLVADSSTVYVSKRDRVLRISRSIRGGSDRVGLTPPVAVVPQAHTVEVSKIDLSLLGHGYFAAAETVLRDMHDVLHGLVEPKERMRLRLADDGAHWEIR